MYLLKLRWLLKITDFGIQQAESVEETLDEECNADVSKLLWKAPELLRDPTSKGTQKGDVYSFAIICYEMFRRPRSEEGPYVDINLPQKQIIENIQYPSRNHFTNNRPDLDAMVKHSEIEPSVKTIGKKIIVFFFSIKKNP